MNEEYLNWLEQLNFGCQLVTFNDKKWWRCNSISFKFYIESGYNTQIGWSYDNWILKNPNTYYLKHIFELEYDIEL